MSSSPNVVRSLSADELASSLRATHLSAATAAPEQQPAPPVMPPPPEPKPKTGLLKRLRRAFRLNAQTLRSSRLDKPSRRATATPTATAVNPNPDLHPNPNVTSTTTTTTTAATKTNTNNAAHQSLQYSTASSTPRRSPIVVESRSPVPTTSSGNTTTTTTTTTAAASVPLASKSTTNIPQRGEHHPVAKHPASRSFNWRTPLGSKTFLERSSPDITEPGRASRRFTGLPTDASKNTSSSVVAAVSTAVPPAASNPPDAPPTDNPPIPDGGPTQQPRSTLRSLPIRVLSSPPSLSGRAPFFGRKRHSATNGKMTQTQPGATADFIADSEAANAKRVFTARNRPQDQPGSMTLDVVTPTNNPVVPSPEHSADAFRTIVEGAAAGRVSFTHLLDAMFRLEERLLPDVKDILIKLLSRPENMDALIDQLTVVVPTVADDEGVEGPGGERERYRYSYVSCMLLSNGPIQLRKSLFDDSKHLDRLVGVLGHREPTDPVVVRSVCKVLLGVLRDSPEQTVHAMGRRKDFIDALLSHIAVTGCPEVCLSMLSTVRCQAELKFGPSNKPVVGMMADSKLVDTLCDKLAGAAENGPLDGTASSTIENCSRVIVGIALRALVIPRYEINDDDSDVSYMMKFNRDLSSLDVFTEPRPILRLLDSGLAALGRHDSRGYALSTALTAVRYLLVTALNGQDSSLSTIRMQLMAVNTAAYEAGVRARIGKMAGVLEKARDGVVVETMWEKVSGPLGVVRLKILELIVVLLQHCSEATAKAIVAADMPQILMRLFVRLRLNSLLQHFVAAIVELAFSGKFDCLRRSFLLDVRLIDLMMELWDESGDSPEVRKSHPVNYTGELLRMIRAVHEFFQVGSDETEELRAQVGAMKIDAFERFYEGPVSTRLKENGRLHGPGELPPRPMDNLAIDGYAGVAAAQGPVLRPRVGEGAVNS